MGIDDLEATVCGKEGTFHPGTSPPAKDVSMEGDRGRSGAVAAEYTARGWAVNLTPSLC